MTRQQLEHLIRAAATIADDDELVVIGSQSILGMYPSAPEGLLVSVEADLYPLPTMQLSAEQRDLIAHRIGRDFPISS